MFRFVVEHFLMRFSYLFAIGAFLSVFLFALILDLMRDDDAERIAFQQAVIADLGSDQMGASSFDKPHLSVGEIEQWVNQAVSESMTFDISTYKDNAQEVYKYFTREGFNQYQDYLKNSGIFENLKNGNLKIGVFVDGQPLQLSAQNVGGVYKWLYQVPLTVSFLPRRVNDLVGQDIDSRKLNLRIQVTRVKLENEPEAVKIESWQATVRR